MKNGGLQPEGYIPLSNNKESTSMAMLVGAGEFAKHDKETGIYIFPITMLANARVIILIVIMLIS